MRALPASLKALPTGVAGRKPTARPERAELFWRISVPISALLLVLLAIPLSYVNPRMGRSFNLFTALFMYMLYSNCLNIVQSFIAQGRLSLLARARSDPHASRPSSSSLLFQQAAVGARAGCRGGGAPA